MSAADLTAVVLFIGITAYAVFGGADFGGGFWDLVAGGDERGRRPRAVIEHAIGPVWEANHVWLIFCLVVLWTCFSEVFASVMLTMFVPLSIAALGIVLRGSSFAFRKVAPTLAEQRLFGAVFATSSVMVPYCLGAVVGGIVAGRVPAGGTSGDLWTSWTGPTSVVGGLLAVAVCAYLAAVYLANDAGRLGEADLVGYFRRRAVGAAVVAGLLAAVGFYALSVDAKHVHDHLTDRSLALVALSALCGLAALYWLLRDRLVWARLAAVGAVAAVVWGWGVAQWPYLLPTNTTVEAAAAPDPTLWTVLVVTVVAVVVIFPALGLLFVLDQRNELEMEPVAEGE